MLKTLNILKKIMSVFYWLLIVLIVFSGISVVLSKTNTSVGVRMFSVDSGSMEPTLNIGSLIFVKATDTYNQGDIITFMGERKKEETFTHRVVEIKTTQDNEIAGFVTKGDANEDVDPIIVTPRRLLGKVVFKVPLLGYLASFAKTQLGFVLLVIIPATVIIYSEIVDAKKHFMEWWWKKKQQDSLENDDSDSDLKESSSKNVPKALIALIALSLMFFGTNKTYAFMLDTESSEDNRFSASVMDIDLTYDLGDADFSSELLPSESHSLDITYTNLGSLAAYYHHLYSFESGDSALCSVLNLEIIHDSISVYDGLLSAVTHVDVLGISDSDDFEWVVSIPDGADPTLSDLSCEFKLIVAAHQDGFAPSTAFFDNESIIFEVNSGDWQPPEVPTGITILNHLDINLGCSGFVNNRSITIDWDDNTEPDFSNYEYRIREGTVIRYPTVSEFSGDIRNEDGDYKYSVRAVDTNGNKSDWGPWCHVTLDRDLEDYEKGDVVINELMWMGSTVDGADEWIELFNDTSGDIDLSYWVISGAGSDDTDLIIPSGSSIPAGGYFLISNFNSDDSDSAIANSITIDYVTEGISLDNDGEALTLFDALHNTIDEVVSGSWVAGENDSDKKSMERNDDPTTGWHTCIDPVCNDTTYWDSEGDNHGTPGSENHSENDPSEESDEEITIEPIIIPVPSTVITEDPEVEEVIIVSEVSESSVSEDQNE